MDDMIKENLESRIEEIENGADGVTKMTKKDYIGTIVVIAICFVGMILGAFLK